MDRNEPPGGPGGRRLVLLRLGGFAFVLGSAFAVVLITGSLPTAGEIRDHGEDLGALATILFVPAFVLANFLVAWPILAGAAGLLFGTAVGTPLALAGVVGAALVQMAVSRYLVGDHAGRLLPERTRAIENFLQRKGALAVAETRIVPALPYGLVNFGAGVTKLRFRDMALGTTLGAAPKVFGYTALGGSLSNLNAPEAKVAIALMIVVAIVGAVLVRRELAGPRPGDAPGAA